MQSPKPVSTRQTRLLRVELSPSTIITLVLVVAGWWVMSRLLPDVLVLVAALIIVGTLSPVVQWLEARGLRRGWSIAIVFTTFLVIILLIVALTLPALLAQVTSLIDQEPALRERLVAILADSPLTASLAEALRTFQYETLITSSGATAFAFSAVEVFAYSIAAIFLALYMMIDRDRLRGGLFSIVPRTHHIRLSRVMMNLETIVGGYIRGQILTCALMAVFLYILLLACGVPNALAIAVFGGVADVLPYIGIFLTMGPAVVAAMAHGPVTAVVVLVLMLAYEEFESRVVAAAILMLIEELRVELPGETVSTEEMKLRKKDDRGEQEYKRRTEGMPAEQAAAVAVEMSDERKKEEIGPPPTPETPLRDKRLRDI